MTRFRSWIGLLSVSLLLAISAVLLFGTLHAIVIVPIWDRLAGGLPFAFVAAIAITWFFTELRRSGRLGGDLRHALAFGALLWISILPTTTVGVISRATGFHRRLENLEMAMCLAVAAATGALMARFFRLSIRLQIAGAVLAVVLVLAMAGPIPVSNGTRPILLLIGFLPLYLFAAVALSLVGRRFLFDSHVTVVTARSGTYTRSDTAAGSPGDSPQPDRNS